MPPRDRHLSLSIKGRLILLAILPMLALLAFAGMRAAEQWRAREEQTKIVGLVEASAALSALAHNLQAERGATNTFVVTKGAKLGDRIPTLRAATDETLAQADREVADAGLPDDVVAPLVKTVQDAHRVAELRTQADAFSRPAPEFVEEYTAVIEGVLDTFGPIGQATTNADIARQVAALSQIAHAKEKAGLQRAQLTAVFASDSFVPGQRDKIRDLVAGQEAFFHAYGISGGHNAEQELVAFEGAQAATDVRAITEKAMARSNGFGQNPDQWFSTATAYVDGLRAIESRGYDSVLAAARDLASDMQVRFWRTVVIVLLVLALTVTVGLWTVRSIVRSLTSIEATLHDMREGRLDVRADVRGDDEISRMGRSLNTALDALEGAMRRITDAAGRLRSSADGMAGVAAGLTTTAGESSRQAREASGSAARVSTDIASLAQAGEQLTTAISEIAGSASRAQTVVSGAVTEAQHAAETVTELGRSSVRINEVLKTVSEISEQTNLLALNATIEAARAGEAGKGFAVVASEVKELAQATTRATEDIAARIAALRSDTEAAATSITQVGATISEIDSIQSAIAAAVEEQSATTQDMADHVEQAAGSSRDIAARVDQVAMAAGRTDSSATTTQDAARSLSELSHELDTIVGRFHVAH